MAEKHWSEPSMVVLCFDVTNESSFSNLRVWLEKYKALRPGFPVRGQCIFEVQSSFDPLIDSGFAGVLVATKIDLQNQRLVSPDVADGFAEEHQLQYFEVSAVRSLPPALATRFVPRCCDGADFDRNQLQRDSHNVNEPFRVLAENLYEHYKETCEAMISAAT